MVYKRVSKIIFAAILAVTVFSGCGNRQEEGIDKTETETTTQKSTSGTIFHFLINFSTCTIIISPRFRLPLLSYHPVHVLL